MESFVKKCSLEEHTKSNANSYCQECKIYMCAKCITNLEDKENGHHKDCDISPINEFERNKKEKLDNNIKTLENLYNSLEKTIKEINETFEKISESKEDLKLIIQKEFTKLRNELNNREDELFIEVDELYNYSFLSFISISLSIIGLLFSELILEVFTLFPSLVSPYSSLLSLIMLMLDSKLFGE